MTKKGDFMKINQINLINIISIVISIIVGILFPKELFGLFVFLGLEAISLITYYLVRKYKTDTNKNTIDIFHATFPIIWGLLYFLGTFSLSRYFGESNLSQYLSNIVLMLMVALESSVLTIAIYYLYKLFTGLKSSRKQATFIWQIIYTSVVMIGLLVAIIIGPQIVSYHTETIFHIHFINTVFVAIPAFVALILKWFIHLTAYLNKNSQNAVPKVL